jgi:aminocarboxymuconate-semialdehyde decarboxylase
MTEFVGGAAPMIAHRLDRGFEIGRMGDAKLERKPSEYLRSMWFDTLTYGSEEVQLLASLAGVDRLLMGSDFPFPIADPDPVGRIERFEWATPEDRAGIMDGNARGLLGLDEGATA